MSVKTKNTNDDTGCIDILISVEDTGVGISENDIDSIFESFKQSAGQNTLQFGGTGLGLTICKRLIEMMNGSITVESAVGKGSTFIVFIQEVEVSSQEIPIIEKIYDIENMKFEKAKILVVDDVESNRNLLSEMLPKVNLDVLIAGNGQESILIAEEYQPDMILMDIRMPVMDGFEATRQLKMNSKTKTIPVIAITASSPTIDKSRVLGKGFDGFLSKPVKMDSLFSELLKFLKLIPKDTDEKKASMAKAEGFPDETVLNLPKIINVLETEFMPQWETFQKKQPIEGVKAFGMRLKELGLSCHFDYLTNYGERLILHVNNFDINNMRATINEFQEMVNRLKSIKE